MSGILGVWNLDGRPLDHSELAELQATLVHRGGDQQNQWIKGSTGLACCLLRVSPQSASEIQPTVGRSGAVAVFDGRLDNREDLLACLPAPSWLNADSPDPDIVLGAYDRYGENFAERLNGDFALGIFDPRRQKLLLARDAIGIRPLYYCWSADRKTFLFASEIKALLAHRSVRTAPNEDALADLLLGSRLLVAQGITCFRDIYSVPPSHLATISAGDFKSRQYWDFDLSARIRLGSFPEYAEAFRERFETAVRRRIRSSYPVAVSVSGGLDSSAIFCMAQTLRKRAPVTAPLVGLSYIFPEGGRADEHAFLGEIERDYGCNIRRIPMGQPGFVEQAESEIWHLEMPFLDPQWSTTQAFNRAVRARDARVLLMGTWADQLLFAQNYLVDLFRAGKWTQVWRHLREFDQWYLDATPGVCWRAFAMSSVRTYAPTGLVPLLRGVRGSVRPARQRSWFTEKFQERIPTVASLRPPVGFTSAHSWAIYQIVRQGHQTVISESRNKIEAMFGLITAFPFLDRDLVSFLMAIPGDVRVWKGVPKAILREGLRDVLPAAIADRRWKADFTDRVNQAVDREQGRILACLHSGAMVVSRGYVREDLARAALKELAKGARSDCVLSWAISDVLGVELWLQTFFGKNSEKIGRSAAPEPESMSVDLAEMTM